MADLFRPPSPLALCQHGELLVCESEWCRQLRRHPHAIGPPSNPASALAYKASWQRQNRRPWRVLHLPRFRLEPWARKAFGRILPFLPRAISSQFGRVPGCYPIRWHPRLLHRLRAALPVSPMDFQFFNTPPTLSTFTGTLLLRTPELQPGQVQQYNANIERQLPGNVVLTVGYAGSHGNHILAIRQ